MCTVKRNFRPTCRRREYLINIDISENDISMKLPLPPPLPPPARPLRREFSAESNEREVRQSVATGTLCTKSRGIAGDSEQGPFIFSNLWINYKIN